MNTRQISWYIRGGKRVAGIEDTGEGWAVVDGEGNRFFIVGDYSSKSRIQVERVYCEFLSR